MLDRIKKLLADGEGQTTEFKKCEKKLTETVFESVSSFSNRYGGYILLGIDDNGTINGVDRAASAKIIKDFANTLNNPQRFAPTLYLTLEEIEINNKLVLWTYVPPNSQIVMFGNKIYDRSADGDMDITRNTMMVAHIAQRKSADFSERKIFPYATEDDLDLAKLMPKVRRLVANRFNDHPFLDLSDSEILRSAGLYQKDLSTGRFGLTLAAILLFGRDETIMSCTANYITDALVRRENLDRYDDRLMVKCNLLDAYEQLTEFIAKHTLDKFCLEGDQSVSARSKIARELVSNILVHREYTSAYPAKIIIERRRIVTENWNLPRLPGRININDFAPYSKNPIIANFFVQIGRADTLGSGVRNLVKYTKFYSGGEPEFIDGDVFKTIVPVDLSLMSDKQEMNDDLSDKISDKQEVNDVLSDKMSDKQEVNDDSSDKMSDKQEMNDVLSDKMSDKQEANDDSSDKIIEYLKKHGKINTAAAAILIGRSDQTARRILAEMAKRGLLSAHGKNRNRTYTRHTIL